jgi:hypothetical protein
MGVDSQLAFGDFAAKLVLSECEGTAAAQRAQKNPDMKSECRGVWHTPWRSGVEWQSRGAKDNMTVEQYHKAKNHLEDKYTRVQIPAGNFAEKIIK